MEHSISFLNMFPDYEPPEALNGVLSQAAIVAADLDPATRWIGLQMQLPTYIAPRHIDDMSAVLRQIYGLKDVSISCRFPAEQLQKIPPEQSGNKKTAD